MFFDDADLVLKKASTLKAAPIPYTANWIAPQEFPNLSGASVISFDTETKENDWKHGPGWSRGKSEIVGFSLAARDRLGNRGKWYFPLAHRIEAESNLDKRQCLGYLNDVLGRTPAIPKTGQNLIFDIGNLAAEGINVVGELHDSSFAEALLDEAGDTNLDWLGEKYLGHGKTTNALYEWCQTNYGGKIHEQRGNIWRAPPRLVGPYGEDDAAMPLDVLDRQWPLLYRERLLDLYRMECDSIPMLIKMRQAGVTIDINAAEKLYAELGTDVIELYGQLAHMIGHRINSIGDRGQLLKAFEACDIQVPRTAEGKPTITKEWLKAQSHPLPALINEIREHEKIRSTFIRSYMLECHRPIGNGLGIIHCEFHPLRSDDGGTKTGRFASSHPNLQNIPIRTALGKRVRRCFVRDPGHAFWRKIDYSQIEYRMLAHFATSLNKNLQQRAIELASCEALRQTYIDNPKTDYHETTYKKCCPLLGWDYELGRAKDAPEADKELRNDRRRPVKNINFSLIYGIRPKGLQARYMRNMTVKQVEEFLEKYHEANPYARSTMAACAQEVQENGYICTIMGRRTRFEQWEPIHRTGEERYALSHKAALAQWGYNIRRAYDYKSTNYKFQGSAADIIKRAMLKCHQDGVFDVTGYPKLQVHDELDLSMIDESPRQKEAYAYMIWVLENTTPTRVPIRVDVKDGNTWGDIG